jgi:hypothetical protein
MLTSEPIAPQTDGRPPAGGPLLTAGSYEAAVAAVDVLADARFPVERVTIVGHGISSVETVTGRYGFARALATGALNGGLIGLFFGLLFDWWGALTPEAAWGWLAVWGLIYGALISVTLHSAFGGGRRDFASARSLARGRPLRGSARGREPRPSDPDSR